MRWWRRSGRIDGGQGYEEIVSLLRGGVGFVGWNVGGTGGAEKGSGWVRQDQATACSDFNLSFAS